MLATWGPASTARAGFKDLLVFGGANVAGAVNLQESDRGKRQGELMFDLFGAEMPLAVRFFLAFLIVLGLIGAAAWAVRRFGAGRIGGVGLRGRQPRLSVIERTNVDGARRWLYLVRRDNIEHLVMIGGPTDIVVESNIVRAQPASRGDAQLPRPHAAEPLPRTIPLPEAATNGSWPLQPEAPPSPPSPRRAPRVEPIVDEPVGPAAPPTERPPRVQRDTLAALAEDLTAQPLPMQPPASVTPMPQRNRPASRPEPVEPHPDLRAEQRPPRGEPRMPTQPVSIEPSAADQSLAEMAQRLEAALRKPKPVEAAQAPPRSAPAADAEDEPEEEAAPPPPPPRQVRAAEAKPARATDSKAKETKALYDTLEQEMASLLGRPAGKI
jgi:flagellar protein FliO/FliZ